MPAYKKCVKLPQKSAQELFNIVDKEIHHLFEKNPTFQGYKVEADLKTMSFKLETKVVTAVLYCREGELELDGKLSLMMLPFRSKIDGVIDRWLEKTFGTVV